nr:zinc-dependent metalloprotease [Allomuricauda sp.]|tara:strand:- start:3447 stop:5762 length:2316 start_codon:yes stop_codon:yes gene_type:complete
MKAYVMFLTLCLWWSYVGAAATEQGGDPFGQAIEPVGAEPFLTSFMKGGEVYLDIPREVLDRPMMFVCYDWRRRSFMQVAWSVHGDNMLFKQQSIVSSAGVMITFHEKLPLEENILAILPIEKDLSGEGNFVVKATDLLLRQEIEWPQWYGVVFGPPVPQLSLVLATKNLAGETLVKVRRGMVKNESKVAVPLYYGFSALKAPMKGRRFDYRMGFFSEEADDTFHEGLQNIRANILRWRLEKKFKDREVSVPVAPITFLISPEVPKKWRPYVKAGIEEWLPAFEAAGFKDALVVKELDSLDEWQAHSIHSNMVYWTSKRDMRSYENERLGGSIRYVVDWRSGEILRGDILLEAPVRDVSEQYFVRSAPLDKRAQRFPFPDELIGALYQQLTAHEAGHVFGLMDGNFGEHAYPWNKMNDSLWLRKMGHTPSVMNYTRSCNIPQPEDSIPPESLLQHVGPADRYHIRWGYREFPEGTPPEVEAAELERMIRWQDTVPWYRFNYGRMEKAGPAQVDEVTETDHPVRSTELALKNIKRVMALLPNAVQGDKDNVRLQRLYAKTVELWHDHMGHVLSVVGGYRLHYRPLDGSGDPYDPIPWEEQMEALDFLLENAMDAPSWLTEPMFHVKTNYSRHADKVMGHQQFLVMDLIGALRLKRIEHMETRWGEKGLLEAYLIRVQNGLFKELKGHMGQVDPRRQELQMTYIDGVVSILQKKRTGFNPMETAFDHTDYGKGILMQRMMDLKREIEKGIKRNKRGATLGHWQLCLKKMEVLW